MNSRVYKCWCFLIVLLVCSITPATAIQNNPNHITSENDWIALFNETYIEDMTKLLNSFDEASNTELTPEQDQYIEIHEDRLLAKSEAILYNLQDFLNILLAELYIENTTTLKSEVINETDPEMTKFDSSVSKMMSYLNNNTVFGGLSSKKCNCSELNKLVANKTYNKGHVVIEVKDPLSSKGYVRYVELVDIYSNSEDDEIQLKVGSELEELTWEEFKDIYGYGNATNKGDFNIIPTNNYPAHYVLKSMCTKQKEDLMDEKTKLENDNWGCNILATYLGAAVMCVGVYRLSDDYKNRVRDRIAVVADDPSEITPLLQHNGLVNCYTRLKDTISSIFGSRYTNSVSIILIGVCVSIGGIIGFCICTGKINECNKNLDNLKQYAP
jgi:hypothetical protein